VHFTFSAPALLLGSRPMVTAWRCPGLHFLLEACILSRLWPSGVLLGLEACISAFCFCWSGLCRSCIFSVPGDGLEWAFCFISAFWNSACSCCFNALESCFLCSVFCSLFSLSVFSAFHCTCSVLPTLLLGSGVGSLCLLFLGDGVSAVFWAGSTVLGRCCLLPACTCWRAACWNWAAVLLLLHWAGNIWWSTVPAPACLQECLLHLR